MKMEVFDLNIYARKEVVAGMNDTDLAMVMAKKIAKREHCDVDVINAFTGEVVYSLVCYLHITYNEDMGEIEKYYEVKEREWHI